MKALVGANHGGLFTYVSPAYEGSTSDRQIVERSGLNALLDPGDDIMADKGFNVEDLKLPYHATLSIPTFFLRKEPYELYDCTSRQNREQQTYSY